MAVPQKRTLLQRLFSLHIFDLRWLAPGIGVKRWLLVVLLGTTLMGVGVAVFISDYYRNAPETWWLPVFAAASLRFLPRFLRVLIFGGFGVGLVVYGIWGFNQTILAPFRPRGQRMVDALQGHRRRERGPRIVVIGGGTGLSNLLRGLKEITHNLTAIVTTSDDGGSSGILRRTLGILPPGDIRNCLAALSNDEALLTQLFQYRFPNGSSGLEGHSFGNLFITALSEITGSFEEAVAESGRVLSVNGRVLPSTLNDVHLVADIRLPYSINEVRVAGESQIPESAGQIRRVWLEPNSPPAFPLAIQALLAADFIIIGPGSLYTSILPNLLVPDIAAAIRSSRAFKVYVCNVATQPGETDHYSCSDHVNAIEEHVGDGLYHLVLANSRCSAELPAGLDWVQVDDELEKNHVVHRSDLIDEARPWRHDSTKLAQVLLDLLQARTGPLVE